MTPDQEEQTASAKSSEHFFQSRSGIVWGVAFLVGIILTRFITLGRQSPWVDEANNWSWASNLPDVITYSHRLTYWMIKLSTDLSNTVYFMRLPMALIFSLSGILLFAYLWKVGQPLWAKFFAIIFVFNPMAIFYSQDANHYSVVFLAGTIALIASIEIWRTTNRGKKYVWLILSLVVLLMLRNAQELIILPMGGLAFTAFFNYLCHPHHWLAGFEGKEKAGRILGYTVAIIALAGALYQLNETMKTTPSNRQVGSIYFTFSPVFQAKLLANVYGAYLFFGVWDYVIGIAAFLVSAYGWLRAGRESEVLRSVWVLFLSSFAFTAIVFLSVDVAQSFHVRYMIFLLPILLIGFALGVAYLFQDLKQSKVAPDSVPKWRLWAFDGAAFIFLLVIGRAFVWGYSHYTGHFQPILPAMQYAANSLPKNSIVGTRNPYLAQAMNHLQQQNPDLQGPDFIWLGEDLPFSRNAFRQADSLAAFSGRQVFTLEMARYDNNLHQSYTDYLENLPVVREFSSSVPQDFFPYDRTLILRAVSKDVDFGKLPQWGSDAIRFYPMAYQNEFLLPNEEGKPPRLVLQPGTGASYLIAADPDAEAGDMRSASIDISLIPDIKNPVFLLGVAEPLDSTQEPTFMLWNLAGTNGRRQLSLPLPNQTMRFHLFHCKTFSTDETPQYKVIEILGIQDTVTDETPLAPLVMSRQEAQAISDSSFKQRGVVEGVQSSDGSMEYELIPSTTDEGSLAMINSNPRSTPVLFIYHFESTGMPSQHVRPTVERGENERFTVFKLPAGSTKYSSTIGPVWAAGVLIPDQPDKPIVGNFNLQRSLVLGPHTGELTFDLPLMVPFEVE